MAFFPSLKQNFIAYHSSKVTSCPDCIFEIHQLWQSDFSRVYSNSCCSCSFEPEIIKIGQSSHKMYSNSKVNFQESTTILNAQQKRLETYWRHLVFCKQISLQAFNVRVCRYETIEEMKEAVTKVIDMLTREDFHGAFQKLLDWYNKCIAAGGDYLEGD